ncbi:MAG: hypothetical protein QOK15_2364 [Nocardioidaceae bacterium]|nr:hypothetical protein [Nocardioidaceae bacterium]
MFEQPVEAEGDDAGSCADALRNVVLQQRLAGARRLAQAAHWADLHAPDDGEDTSTLRATTRRDRCASRQVGGEGTPEISEFAAVELGMLLETSTGSAEVLLRDALDLRHRLPKVWAAVMHGRVEDWKARKVAVLVRPLTLFQAHHVDAEVLDALIGLPFGRALDVVQGRVIAADPVAHLVRREEEQVRRYVSTRRRSNPYGLRTLIAQTTAGDVARLEAMVSHLASLLAAAGDSDPADTRRAKALGLMANPALACVVLAQQSAADATSPEGAAPSDDRVTEQTEAVGDPTHLSPVELAECFGRLLLQLGGRVVDRLRAKTILYLHLSEEAVVGARGTRVARLEGSGPVNLEDLRSLLGHDRVVVKPVIDPTGAEPVDGHEIPAAHRERLRLLHPFEVFPFGTVQTADADGDHNLAYRALADGGPPGQTRLDNLGPLGRRHHRAKTFGGFTLLQPLPGLYLWRTPTGYWFRVDHRGSAALGKETPDIVRQLTPHVQSQKHRPTGAVSSAEQRFATIVGDWVLAT